MCQRLRDELKYDVITFDYRGFGDSTGEPTEYGLVKDARFIYDWLDKLSNGQRKIYLWGHSLGSAVACQLAARLSDDKSVYSLFFILLFTSRLLISFRQKSWWNCYGSTIFKYSSSFINSLVLSCKYSFEIHR